MTIKIITSAIAAGSLLFSAGAATAAASRPQVMESAVSDVKAPVSGVRVKRALKKKSRLGQVEGGAAAAAAGGGVSTVVVVAGVVAAVGGALGVVAATGGFGPPASP